MMCERRCAAKNEEAVARVACKKPNKRGGTGKAAFFEINFARERQYDEKDAVMLRVLNRYGSLPLVKFCPRFLAGAFSN